MEPIEVKPGAYISFLEDCRRDCEKSLRTNRILQLSTVGLFVFSVGFGFTAVVAGKGPVIIGNCLIIAVTMGFLISAHNHRRYRILSQLQFIAESIQRVRLRHLKGDDINGGI